ncbi:MAG: aminotransferase class I/II-fold pyridoxal phosphate-dependent enzyme [Ignavibacteriae bacterium]|nr:aminotransferase class I/II-fold pyridoxal phosphate-dependent enzyme [Ignavibacteriota bacterium]
MVMIIDLRSDTVTVPTQAMREAIASARVGDDVYGEDITVNELREYAAHIFNKESALFVPTGVIGNQICIALHTQWGDEVIVESECHILHYETAAASIISSIQFHCVPSNNGEMEEQSIRQAIRTKEYYFPRTSLICVENTHNRHGGTILSIEHIAQTAEIARESDCAFHCDGARIWNAAAATGISVSEYAQHFDTLSVCLSKGLGAPVGSLILGTKKHITAARKLRKILGGGMRQAGMIAAGGLHALTYHRELLVEDHVNAFEFANRLAETDYFKVELGNVQTNIVIFAIPQVVDTDTFLELCKEQGLLLSKGRVGFLRAVFHFQINEIMTTAASEIMIDAVQRCL